MEDGMSALLKKSRLLSHHDSSFFAKAEAIPPKNFLFWLPLCFDSYSGDKEEVKVDRFKCELQRFFRRYFEAWLSVKENLNVEVPFLTIADFFLNLNAEKIYLELEPGGKIVDIGESLSGAIFSFCRFNDILAFNVYRMRERDKQHTTGLQAIRSMCQTTDPHNNQGIYELFQRVEIALAVPDEAFPERGNSRKYNLDLFGKMLSKTLYYASINFSPEKLIEAYEELQGGVSIGNCHGLDIQAHLIHKNASKKDDIASEKFQSKDRARIWRRGNVNETGKGEYVLQEGGLMLIVAVCSSLPPSTYYGNMNPEDEFHREQFLLAEAGSMVAASLASMMMDSYLKIHLEMNPIQRKKK